VRLTSIDLTAWRDSTDIRVVIGKIPFEQALRDVLHYWRVRSRRRGR
jgi:hypothetical protein